MAKSRTRVWWLAVPECFGHFFLIVYLDDLTTFTTIRFQLILDIPSETSLRSSISDTATERGCMLPSSRINQLS